MKHRYDFRRQVDATVTQAKEDRAQAEANIRAGTNVANEQILVATQVIVEYKKLLEGSGVTLSVGDTTRADKWSFTIESNIGPTATYAMLHDPANGTYTLAKNGAGVQQSLRFDQPFTPDQFQDFADQFEDFLQREITEYLAPFSNEAAEAKRATMGLPPSRRPRPRSRPVSFG